MPIELKMPALSPTMEEGTLAKWLVKVGDVVKPGDLIAEIETDKATMEYEAIDEGRISEILISEGSEGVAVGAILALLASEGEVEADADAPKATIAPVTPAEAPPVAASPSATKTKEAAAPAVIASTPGQESFADTPRSRLQSKVKVSPLALRIASFKKIDLDNIVGSGPGGRILRKDLGLSPASPPTDMAPPKRTAPSEASSTPVVHPLADLPHELVKMSNMRKTIARRLTESKQHVPHIYLSLDVRLDALLTLRADLNEAYAARGGKLSVNDMIIKALALALIEVPACNVQFAGDHFAQFQRADISVAVSIPGGLITPVITGAETKSLSTIAADMRDLAERARAGKLQPHEYQGGTASLSNLGMFGISQFNAIINPPQAMIMAVGAGEERPVVENGAVTAATVMTVTGSFDHRVIDGADAAALMQAFQRLLQTPLRLA
jgi:pyruvate dehydrogenase E2 component (dihydrolipoamide acetyltransferase)